MAMPILTNPQLELAERYLCETGVSVFLTGKAGTGKTTFLKNILNKLNKRNVVVAPTGVAAVNAGGVTIHSFFQLPFCPYLPDVPELLTEYQMPEHKKQLRKNKANVIRTLEVLIIDEISMVRADLLDAIDDTLRRYRRSSRPFGGVQLLMIGDVHQLPPVVTDEEKPYLERVYPSPFFFHSKALQRLEYVTIELQTVYRQQDGDFLRLLNNVRDNRMDAATFELLNSRYMPDEGVSGSSESPIRLTTHNYQADEINRKRLGSLSGKSHTFNAKIKGNFPESSAPTELTLEFKKGAQVMFVKNDSTGQRRYYNGKIGVVESFDDEAIWIESESESIEVKCETWENVKYEINQKNNQIEPRVDGTFEQFPLKLAWAVTIHKAQGLTFDKVVVDAASAFAYGQVYVALSRCRTLEGLSLSSRISPCCTFENDAVRLFNESQPSEEQVRVGLEMHAAQYSIEVLFEMLGLSGLQRLGERLERVFVESLSKIYPASREKWSMGMRSLNDLVGVSERFKLQIMRMASPLGVSAMNDDLVKDRIAKAVDYFEEQLRILKAAMTVLLDVEIENKEVQAEFKNYADQYADAIGEKVYCLQEIKSKQFSVEAYQKAKVDYVLRKDSNDVEVKKNPRQSKKLSENIDVRYPQIIPLLTAWRRMKSDEFNVRAYQIMTQKTLYAIADKLPRTPEALKKIPGIGKLKMQQFGNELLEVISDFCIDEGIK